jgi:mannose/fructose/N-acetylgalactosamine-specific phosphotransferase system component IIC
LQLQLPGSAAKVDINMISGAVASTAIPNATQEADGTWTIALPVALAPSGDTVSAWCLGFSSNNSL